MKTTLYTVLCVAIRLAAVLMAVELVITLLSFWLETRDRALRLIELCLIIVGLLIAAALWLKPGLLARWAVGRSGHEVLESSLGADAIQRIAFATLGAWLFVGGLSSAVPQVWIMWQVHRMAAAYPGMAAPAVAGSGVAHSVVQLVAGAVLLLGAHGLTGMLHRLRGYPHVDNKPDNRDTGIAQDD
jgi:hypothetical protein